MTKKPATAPKWTDDEKVLVSDYLKRLRALGFKRGGFYVLKLIRENGLTSASSDADKEVIWNRLVKSSSVTKAIVDEIAAKCGYSPVTIRNDIIKKKLDIHSPAAIERYIAAKQKRKGALQSTSLNELGQVVLPSGELLFRPGLVWQPDALPHEPETHLKQFEFLSSNEDIVLAEGGKGSGKSDLLVIDCLRTEKVEHPRWLGVIFRREYKRLEEIISRAHFHLGRMPWYRAHWQGHKSRFVFPSGAALAFHNVQNLGDEEQYQGWEICDLKFDQLEEFAETQFNYLALQNRAGSLDLRPTVRATANPGGQGHAWVKRRFITDKEPHIPHEITLEVEGHIYRKTYRRIHMTVFDNPLLKRDERYIATLAMEPDPVKRKAMLKGDWDIVIGQFFTTLSRDVHGIQARELPRNWKRAGGLDYGNTKVIEFLACDHFGNVYVEWEFSSEATEFNPDPMTASQFALASAEFMLDRNIGEGLLIIGDVNLWSTVGRDVGSTRTPAMIIQGIWKEEFEKKNKRAPALFPVSKQGTEEYRYRVACNEATKDYLSYEISLTGEVKKDPKLFIMDRAPKLMETMPLLRRRDDDWLDFEKIEDHWYDAFKMPFMQVMISKRPDTGKNAQEKWDDMTRLDHIQEKNYVSADYRIDCV